MRKGDVIRERFTWRLACWEENLRRGFVLVQADDGPWGRRET